MFTETLSILKTHSRLILVAFLLFFFSAFGQSVFIGIYIPDMQEKFGLDHAKIGILYGAATLLSSILLLYTGKKLDFMPLRRFVLLSLAGLTIGAALIATAWHPVLLFSAFLLLRHCGQGLMLLSGNTAINRYIENGRGRSLSVAQTGMSFHLAVFPLLGVTVTALLGFQGAWIAYTAFTGIILIPLFWFLLRAHEGTTHADWAVRTASKELESGPFAGLKDDWTRRQVLRDWRFYTLITVMICAPAFTTVLFFYQGAIAETLGISPTVLAAGFIFFTGASVLSSFAAGFVLDRFGETVLLLVYPVAYAAGLLCVANTSGHLFLLYPGLMLMGAGTGAGQITGGPLFAKMYGTKHFAAIKSLSFTAALGSTAISPPLAGWLIDSGIPVTQILSGFAVYAFVSWLVIVSVRHKLVRE